MSVECIRCLARPKQHCLDLRNHGDRNNHPHRERVRGGMIYARTLTAGATVRESLTASLRLPPGIR